ncbi:ribose transport system substrate-binding protein [Roseibium hamelinense]|uniref:Ribose transport system substrate-binding protein n=1 Tax=Roseibium hamelinense TaxID=150831 RepID=A0A562SH15_9HYPH|nr:substrate-binding domain-containing protein [Roseibium hamelinense]MTI44196.1 hypothetical protein [Roseibium hamelinense]TWI80020.1 ribose transport system substrate-binding protein [Roseibium hamelinense]
MPLKCLAVLAMLVAGSMPANAACIGAITSSTEHQFWRELIRGVNAAGAHANVEVYVRSPNTETNEEGQRIIVEKAIDKGCIGIVIAPNSPQVLKGIAEVQNGSIPVVFVDRDVGTPRISAVKTDNYAAGKLAGQKLAEILNGKGKVALLRMLDGVSSTMDREQGFLDAIRDTELEVTLETHIGSTVGEARINTSVLFADGAHVDGIFTPNESTTVGALVALKKLGFADKIHHVGFDFTPVLTTALESGELSGVVIQNPYEMGYQGTLTLVRILNGESVDEFIDIPATYVDKTNLHSPEVQDIISGK